jgi:hypothetical protein
VRFQARILRWESDRQLRVQPIEPGLHLRIQRLLLATPEHARSERHHTGECARREGQHGDGRPTRTLREDGECTHGHRSREPGNKATPRHTNRGPQRRSERPATAPNPAVTRAVLAPAIPRATQDSAPGAAIALEARIPRYTALVAGRNRRSTACVTSFLSAIDSSSRAWGYKLRPRPAPFGTLCSRRTRADARRYRGQRMLQERRARQEGRLRVLLHGRPLPRSVRGAGRFSFEATTRSPLMLWSRS